MPRATQTSSSESDREEPDASPPPLRRHQTVPKRANAGPRPGRQGPRRGSAPGTYPDNDDDDGDDTDGEEPKAPRGGRPRPIQRRAAPDDADREDDSPSPLAINTSASRGRGGRGGRAGRPRPISTHVRSDDDALDAERSDYGTPPPRRRASTVSGRRPNDGEVGSPGRGRHPPNPRRRRSPSPVTFSPIEPDSPTEDLEVRSPGPGRRPLNPRQRQRSPSPVTFSPIEPDSPTEDWDDNLREALAVSQAEPQPVRPSEDDEFEEQLRQVMKASSKAEAAAQKKRASKQSNEEEQLRRLMERSEKEHREQERARVRSEREEARRQEKEFERALSESQSAAAAQRSDHLEEEDTELECRLMEQSEKEHREQERTRVRREREEARRQEEEFERALRESQRAAAQRSEHLEEDDTELERAIRLSQVTHNADVRKAAERMAGQRATAPQSPSWTEGRVQSGGHGEESASTTATPSSAPTESASSPRLRRNLSQRITSDLSGMKKATTRPRSSSVLAPIPENAAAGPSSPTPLPPATPSSSKAIIKTPSSSRTTVLTTRPKAAPAKSDSTPALPFIPGKPPIDPDRLIAMCERAFPPDRAIATAIRNSQRTASIETVQNGANEYDEQLAAVLAESAAHAQAHQDRPADITDVGLDDPPPDYHTSSRDRRLDAVRWTTSDYRREQPGYQKEISPEIREIMRLYGELKAYLKFIEPPDPKGEKIEREKQERLLLLSPPRPPTPADGSVVVTSRKRKGKETDDDDDAAAQIPPPEIADSLDDIFRPARRAEVGGTPSASARNFAANLPTAAARQRAMEQQSHSAAISASRLPNSRPQRPKAWEPQVERFGRLMIVEEEEEEEEEPPGRAEERMSKGTARRVRQDRNYRRSGI